MRLLLTPKLGKGDKAMIKMENVEKKFGAQTVLKNVNINVAEGEIFGLLGPSGAGKTTIINILTNQLKPDSGVKEVSAKPHEMGIMLDIGGLYEHLTCQQNLELYAEIYGLPKKTVPEVMAKVGLGGNEKKSVEKLSRGMTQRLALARAILYKPKLLFLDEPTSALDPGTSKGVCALLEELRQEGATIFLTTHNMDEALKLCDRIGLLHNGEIIEQGNPVDICDRHESVKTMPDLESVFLKLTGVQL